MKIGLMSYGAPVNRYDIAQNYLEQTADLLKNSGYEVEVVEKVVMDDTANEAAMTRLEKEKISLLIVQIGTFAQGNMMVDLMMRFFHTPFFVWGFNDPIVKEHPTVPLNSLTGMAMMTSYLHKIGKKFSYAYGDFGDEKVYEKLFYTVKAIELKEQLRNSRYAVVGSRVPGFYRCMVDELRFRNEIGPEIVYYSLASMLNDAKNQDNEKVEQRLNEILNTNKVTVEKDMLEKNIRMELALKDFAEREKIDAITMKCWPELQDLYQCAGCAAISALNDSGITACCEGDVTGLVMMDILKKMTGQSVFFADLVSLTQSGGIKAWHCGFGPKGLANDSEDISYVEQATMRNGIGTGVQYTMKQGRLSMCGFSEQDAAYKIFLNVGEGVETDRELLGVQTDICSPKKAGSILDTIIEEGFGQHFALVHTDVEEQMKEFAKWMNIKLITE